MVIVCGTGHRPNKMWGWDTSRQEYHDLVEEIKNHLKENKVDRVITGMALGFDTLVAVAAIQLKKENVPIEIHAYIPFVGQELIWPKARQENYHKILKLCDKTIICSNSAFTVDVMNFRNKMMVDNSDYVLAYWNGTSGGTANCIAYAQSLGRKIINLYK